MAREGGLSWTLRRLLWDGVILFKYRVNKPADIPLPVKQKRRIRSVPLRQAIPSVHVERVLVADRVPADEASRSKRAFYAFQIWLSKVFGPHLPGLPAVDPDPEGMLRQAYGPAKRKLYAAPVLPDALANGPDLAALAVTGPHIGYLRPAGDGQWEWDLRELGRFEPHEGLHSTGVRVLFDVDRERRALAAAAIECDLGAVKPGEPEWELARRIAACAINNHVSLVRHFNGVHLAIGTKFSIATRNNLPPDHPLCRLLWPHLYGTHFSNDLVTLGQMDPAGDFANVFSLTQRGICDLFDATHAGIRFEDFDPTGDPASSAREAPFATPGNDNLAELLSLFERHTQRYVAAYWDSDEALRADEAVANWLIELGQIVPNGVGLAPGEVTRAKLARLVALFMHVVIVEHELRGSGMWNYQLWAQAIPTRVRRDGQGVPIDVYQRLVNANMLLNVQRAPLTRDFSYLALDAKGEELFRQFRQELLAAEAAADGARPPWLITAGMLKANMNA